MKSSELMLQLLALPLEQKETFHVVLGHSIKTESQSNSLVQAELEAADAVAAALPELSSGRGPGRPLQADSTFGLVHAKLQKSGKASQEELIQLIMEKKGWERSQAANNLYAGKSKFMKHGIQSQGRGSNAIWFAPTSNN